MKSIKILGIAVAVLGVAASVGGAIALYTKPADEVGFGIGAGSYSGKTGAVTYKVNGNTSGSVAPIYYADGKEPGTGLGGVYDQVKYVFALSAEFASDLTAQSYVMGNIGLSVTNIPAKYQDKLSIWASIEGYDSGKYGETAFSHALMGSDYAITSTNPSYSGNANISVDVAGVQSLVVYMKYDLTGVDLLTLNEESLGYTLNVTWGAPTNTNEIAYVVGTGNSWTIDEDFAMAINIKADSKEWVYNGLEATASWTTGAKCRLNDGDNNTWSAGDDATLVEGKTYDIYWAGNGSAVANFSPRS